MEHASATFLTFLALSSTVSGYCMYRTQEVLKHLAPFVELDDGILTGIFFDDTAQFLGISFAQPRKHDYAINTPSMD